MTLYTRLENTHLIRDWSALIALSADEVAEIQKTWEKTFDLNMRLYRNARADEQAAVENAAEFMTAQGVEIYKYRRNGRTKEFLAWFENNVVSSIRAQYPTAPPRPPVVHTMEQEVDGLFLWNNTSPTDLVTLHARITQQYQQAQQRERETNELLRASLEYAAQYDLNIDGLTNGQVIATANRHAGQAFLDTVEPGTPMDLNTMFHNCDMCDLYFAGDHRCDCSNRRINMFAGGDLLSGFEVMLEAY